MKVCYQCKKETDTLSRRSRCVNCEYIRAEFNEVENCRLRNSLVLCHHYARCDSEGDDPVCNLDGDLCTGQIKGCVL